MPVYLASDMHLRLDRPERGRRLARWVDSLSPDDTLHLMGDVCDFWYATRQRRGDSVACEGLRSLANFKSRGGELTVLLGNHDLHLGAYYQRVLGADLVEEPRLLEVHGLTLHLVHGHRVGGRQPWKAGMESAAFFQAFGRLPAFIAGRLDAALEKSNDQGRIDDEARLTDIYRRSLASLPGGVDLAVFGHVHSPIDDTSTNPRMIILGGWHHGSSYLRIDQDGAELMIGRGEEELRPQAKADPQRA